MDQENQAQIRALVQKYGEENLIAVLGSADPEMAAIAAETIAGGNPTFADPLAEAQLGLKAYHVVELKAFIDHQLYLRHLEMMEMILDITGIIHEVSAVRKQFFPSEVSV